MGDYKEGAKKRRETLIKMLGSEALYLDYMRSNGSKGGRTTGEGKGFASKKPDKNGLTGKDRAKRSRWTKIEEQ